MTWKPGHDQSISKRCLSGLMHVDTTSILFTNEQSRKFQVHGKDINDKFGKVPLPTICVHKYDDLWQTWGVLLKGKIRACADVTQLMLHIFWKPMSVPYMFSVAGVFAVVLKWVPMAYGNKAWSWGVWCWHAPKTAPWDDPQWRPSDNWKGG